ncbi:DUF5801 repeats-in-toxin domain-containing protein, partial [Arcobacter sp. LA11]|uniref:DUF5801 repeats-in-toxin domain-containing protein n=1 Tax=Arcobacter sp. LA11 TaxID=1898176 RepID=UPI000934D9F4
MIKLIIKNPDGSQTTKEITQDTTLSPSAGQQFYFDNTDGSRKYTFNLSDGDESVELIFAGNGERLVLNLKGMAELIKQSDDAVNENTKTVLGIMDDNDGMKELNETALNNDFQGDKVISELKELLADTTNPDEDYQNGIIIDDFGALLERLDAAAAGGELGQGSGFTNDTIDPSGQVYGVDGRGRGTTVDPNDPNGEIESGENNTPIIIGDIGTVFERGLVSANNDEFYDGSFRVESPDGIGSITIGGRVFTEAQLLDTNTTESTNIPTGEGNIVINGYTQISTGVAEISYTYELIDNLEHDDELADGSATNDDVNNIIDTISITVEDPDGDTASAQLVINIIDDVPNANIYFNENEIPTLVTDDEDTIGSNSDTATASFASLFTDDSTYGADDNTGETSKTIDYTLSVTSAVSGLTHEGLPIVLSVNASGVIEGNVAGILEPIFTVSVDSSGNITLTQNAEIDHVGELVDGDATNNDVNNIGLIQGNVILTATVTVIDSDGDLGTGSDSLDISSAISFNDDVPKVNSEIVSAEEILVDESPVPTDGDGIKTAFANYADNFGPVNYGADGAGSVSYALVLTGTDVSTGIYALGINGAKGTEIVLNQDLGTGIISGTANGITYFTISSDVNGKVTFTQVENVWHSNTTDHDDVSVLNAAKDALVLKQTITDFDDDEVSANLDLSQNVFKIEDDGPDAGLNATVVTDKQANNITLTVDETEGVDSPADDNGDRSSKADFSSL